TRISCQADSPPDGDRAGQGSDGAPSIHPARWQEVAHLPPTATGSGHKICRTKASAARCNTFPTGAMSLPPAIDWRGRTKERVSFGRGAPGSNPPPATGGRKLSLFPPGRVARRVQHSALRERGSDATCVTLLRGRDILRGPQSAGRGQGPGQEGQGEQK